MGKRQGLFCTREQGRSSIRRFHAAWHSMKKGSAHQRLEIANLHRERGLRHVKACGRFSDATGFGDSDKQTQAP